MAGGGGGSNSAQIAEQRRAAEESRRKEAERQARLDYGIQQIDYLFGGFDPASDSIKSYSDFLPDEYEGVGGQRASDGGIYAEAPSPIDVSTFSAKDWQTPFLQDYQNAHSAYYTPQLNEQFDEAQKELTYSLARAGLTRSDVAAQQLADLQRQRLEQEAAIKSQGDQATGDLRQRIQSNRQTAINQLYSTENPDVGANSALTSVRTIQAEQPRFSPLGDLFRVAQIGVNNVANAQRERRAFDVLTAGSDPASGSSRIVY